CSSDLHRFDRPEPRPGEVVEIERRYRPDGTLRFEETRRAVGATDEVERQEWSFDGLGRAVRFEARGGTASSLRLIRTITYGGHEARGLHREETIVGDLYPSPGVSTVRTYDASARLIRIADADDPSRLWKEFVYGESNGPADSSGRLDRSLGKRIRAVRHNYSSTWASSAHHTVEESFVYRGVGGRVSDKTTTLATIYSSSMEMQLDRAFVTSVVYDEVGRIAEVVYPSSVQPAAGEPTDEVRVSYSRDWLGRVTSVGGSRGTESEGWIDSVTRHASGLPAETLHANSVRDVYTPDPSGLERASRVEVLWETTTHHDSGALSYDGRGSLCGRGSQSLALAPDELEPRFGLPDDCTAAMVRDPFGHWNGEIDDAACTFDGGPQPLVLRDPSGFPFGVIDLTAYAKVYTAEGPQWVRDPANYTHTWILYGLDGRLLRQVEDHYQGAWRQTLDRVHGLSRRIGVARVRAPYPNIVERYHQHPMMTRQTDWR
ncbi:MAG: hypothetical protein MI919_06970, partial [Holophagales bacterium]|nr:hypothetical protein [Holophagales bacterium]